MWNVTLDIYYIRRIGTFAMRVEVDCLPSESSIEFSNFFIQTGLRRILWASWYTKVQYVASYLCMYLNVDKFSTWKLTQDVDAHLLTKKFMFNHPVPSTVNNMQLFLYSTVTAEKAAKHIVTSKIRKWPHRETFSASSICCMNL
jgi:hypothetical protein